MVINAEKLFPDRNVTYLTKNYQQFNFTSPRHYHYEYEIAYIEKSCGKLFVGNNITSFKPGDLFLFAPRLVHAFKNDEIKNNGKKYAKATIIFFKTDFFGIDFLEREEAFDLKKLLIDSEKGIRFNNPDPNLVKTIIKLPGGKGLDSIIDFISILNYLLACKNYSLLSLKWFKKSYYTLKDDRMNELMEYVDNNYLNEAVFENARQMTNMSKSAFSRFFKNKTELTFTQYVNDIKLTNAQKLLIETNLKIKDVYCQCGYNNMTYFNRLFRKVNGTTPKHFREIYLHPDRIR